MSEEHVFDLLPAYALGSLDEDELIQVSEHLSRCRLCRNELATYENTVDQMVQALPLQTPAADLKAKMMQRAQSSGAQSSGALSTGAQGRDAQNARKIDATQNGRFVHASKRSFGALLRELLSLPMGMAFAFTALLLIVLLAGSSFALWQRMNRLQSEIPSNAMQIVHLAGTETAPQTRGYLMVFKNENYGTLVVEDAPPLQSGYQYQLWLIKDGKRISGGVFSVNDQGYGTLQVAANQSLERYPSFGVTIEPAGGSPGPTGKKVLGGSL